QAGQLGKQLGPGALRQPPLARGAALDVVVRHGRGVDDLQLLPGRQVLGRVADARAQHAIRTQALGVGAVRLVGPADLRPQRPRQAGVAAHARAADADEVQAAPLPGQRADAHRLAASSSSPATSAAAWGRASLPEALAIAARRERSASSDATSRARREGVSSSSGITTAAPAADIQAALALWWPPAAWG